VQASDCPASKSQAVLALIASESGCQGVQLWLLMRQERNTTNKDIPGFVDPMKFLTFAFVLLASLAAFGQRASLAQQKICASQARTYFEEYYKSLNDNEDNAVLRFRYTNHYDAKKGACYVFVYKFGEDSALDFGEVDDAFEGTQQAFFPNPQHETKQGFITRIRKLYGVEF
jgi:hypothetical protein